MLSYELMSITTWDGIKYTLTDGVSRFVVTTPGEMGLPPIEYLTQRSYRQDGATETGFRLGTRPFAVNFRHNGCSRVEYWQIRESLLNITRPNRGGQMIFTIRLSTGELRSIVVRSTSPTFPEIDVTRWDENSFSEILQFEAFDPIWFDPANETYALVNDPADELAFPITFDDDNIFFGGDSYGIANITYEGTWYAYPIIRIGAPFDNVVISNITNGASIALTTGVSTGYIDFNFQNLTITDNNGNDLWGYLTPDSDVQQFRLEPNPIAPNGVNEINFFLAGYSPSSTTVEIFYNNRYVGI